MKIIKKILIFLFIHTSYHAEAIIFTCSYSSYDNAYSGPGFQCLGRQILASGNSSHVTNVTGTASENLKVNFVVFSTTISSCSEVTQVPRGLLNFFPKLDFLALQNCGIDTLNGHDLDEYPKLKRFDITGGNIQYLPGNFFASTPLIETIYFSSNNIKNVGVDLLINLNNLRIGMILNQTCINYSTQWSQTGVPVQNLINELHANCPDIEVTTIQPQCVKGDNDERICALEKDNEKLKKILGFFFNEFAKNLKDLSVNVTEMWNSFE